MSAVHSETEHAPPSLINDVVCAGMCAEQLIPCVTLPFGLWGLLVRLWATPTHPHALALTCPSLYSGWHKAIMPLLILPTRVIPHSDWLIQLSIQPVIFHTLLKFMCSVMRLDCILKSPWLDWILSYMLIKSCAWIRFYLKSSLFRLDHIYSCLLRQESALSDSLIRLDSSYDKSRL